MYKEDVIIVCAPSNQAAKICCQKLFEVPSLSNFVILTLSENQ
jgi:hypothetical protein